MTIVAALLTRDWAVMASDGLGGSSAGPDNEVAVKSCRLAEGKALACVGESVHARHMLCSIDERASDLNSRSPFAEWESQGYSIDYCYSVISDRLQEAYETPISHLAKEDPKNHKYPRFLLVSCGPYGVSYNVLTATRRDGTAIPSCEERTVSIFDSMARVLTLGVEDDESLLLDLKRELKNERNGSEAQRLVKYIRSIGRLSDQDYKVNNNVLVRDSRNDFGGNWFLSN